MLWLSKGFWRFWGFRPNRAYQRVSKAFVGSFWVRLLYKHWIYDEFPLGRNPKFISFSVHWFSRLDYSIKKKDFQFCSFFFLLDRKSRKIVQWDFETESLAGCSENDHSENNNLIKKFAVIPLLARTAVFGNSTPPTAENARKKRIRNSLSTYYIYQRKTNTNQRLAWSRDVTHLLTNE